MGIFNTLTDKFNLDEVGIFNTLTDKFNLDEDDYKIIPINGCPTKFYSINFDGWGHFSSSSTDSGFIIAVNLAVKTIRSFIELYKETHAFTQPQFYYKPDGTFGVKIGTMENELYDQIYNKNE